MSINCQIHHSTKYVACTVTFLSFAGIKVMVEPESQIVFSGQMVKLSCWAAGYPLLHYQWFKKEKEVNKYSWKLLRILRMLINKEKWSLSK